MARQEFITAFAGLHTAPSAYGTVPPGALKTADNVVIRNPSVVEPRPGFTPALTQASVPLTSVWALLDFDSGVTVGPALGPATRTIYNGTAGITTPAGADLTWTRGRIFGARARKNLYVTAGDALRKISPAGTTAPRAGLAPPFIAITEDPAGTLAAANSYYSYRAVKVRRDASGLIVRSAPSNRVIYGNTQATVRNVRIRVWQHQSDDNSPATEEWEVYRSRVSSSSDVLDEHFLCKTFGPLSTDTNLTEDFVDSVADVDLGAALYTNADEEGIENANFRPPQAQAVAEFNGSLVLGDLTFPASKTVSFTYTSGLAAATSAGIGDRSVVGTFTNGSNQITGIASTAGFRVGQIIRDTVGEWSGATDFVRVTAVGANTLTMSATFSGATAARNETISDSIRIGSQYFPMRALYEEGLVSFWSGASTIPQSSTPSTQVYAFTNDVIRFTRTGAGVSNTAPGIRTITFEAILPTSTPFTIHATHGSEYTPPLPEPTATGATAGQDLFPSGVIWSKFLEPEHFSVMDLQQLGADESEVWRLVRGGDGLWIFKQDGLWRLSGASRDAGFRPDRVSSVRLLHPNAAAESGDRAFAWTDKGILALSAGVSELQSTAIRDQLRVVQTSSTDAADYGIWLAANTKNNEVLVGLPGNSSGNFTTTAKILVYNLETSAWTSWNIAPSCARLDRLGVLTLGLETAASDSFAAPLYITRREVQAYEAVQNYDFTAPLNVTAVTGRNITFTTTGSYVPLVGDCIVGIFADNALYWVTAVTSSTQVQLDRTGFQVSAAVTAYRGYSSSVAPVACTAKNPSTLKLWGEGSWLFGSTLGLVSITLDFGSSRAEGAAGFTRVFTDTVTSQAHTNNPRSERFIVHPNYSRAEQLFPELSVDNAAGTTWRVEGLSLFYQPMSPRLSR